MKKRNIFLSIIMLSVVMIMATNMSFGQNKTATFDVTANVQKYIEVLSDHFPINFGNLPAGQKSAGWVGGMRFDAAYANCPFSVTLSGFNGSG
jgi:hypothetical protein